MKTLTSTATSPICRFVSHEKAIEYIAKAGFDAFDFSLYEMIKYDWDKKCAIMTDSPLAGNDYLKYVRHLRQVADDLGIICNQSHAPFPSCCKEIVSMYKRAIECTAELGGQYCVIHPDNDKSAQKNAEMYMGLLPFAKEYNVKIATENMWNWDYNLGHATKAACSHHDDFLAHIKAVDDDYFVACLDIGHAEMKGLDTNCVKMISTLKNHIKVLHIHDNDLIHDDHKLPGSMDIDFMPILKELKKIGYDGYFTLETSTALDDYTAENVFEGIKKMSDTVREMANTYENL